MNEHGSNLMFLNATWQFHFHTTRTEGAQRVTGLENTEEKKGRDEKTELTSASHVPTF
jgi:hypothetical protein